MRKSIAHFHQLDYTRELEVLKKECIGLVAETHDFCAQLMHYTRKSLNKLACQKEITGVATDRLSDKIKQLRDNIIVLKRNIGIPNRLNLAFKARRGRMV